MTYSEALSSSSEDTRNPKGVQDGKQKTARLLMGAKRPRSPIEHSCGRCFRSTHKTEECRHQVIYLRYVGVGHVTANCRVETRCSQKRKMVHVWSKHSFEEQAKKPSFKWNEEARYVAEPPRSTKKKVLHGEPLKGMSSKPLFISNWSNAQIASYCYACGILFDDYALHMDAFIDYIRKVEKTRSLSCVGSHVEQAETSPEVSGN